MDEHTHRAAGIIAARQRPCSTRRQHEVEQTGDGQSQDDDEDQERVIHVFGTPIGYGTGSPRRSAASQCLPPGSRGGAPRTMRRAELSRLKKTDQGTAEDQPEKHDGRDDRFEHEESFPRTVQSIAGARPPRRLSSGYSTRNPPRRSTRRRQPVEQVWHGLEARVFTGWKPANTVGRPSVAAIERRVAFHPRRPTRGSDATAYGLRLTASYGHTSRGDSQVANSDCTIPASTGFT